MAEALDVVRMRTQRLRRIQKTLISRLNAVRGEWAVAEVKEEAGARVGSEYNLSAGF